ncbi:hypothetical protein TNCV_958071 [Trichonephila clavipes]|nr:hypothetical protein TNCV_958071 [Trichonephila clavipes]
MNCHYSGPIWPKRVPKDRNLLSRGSVEQTERHFTGLGSVSHQALSYYQEEGNAQEGMFRNAKEEREAADRLAQVCSGTNDDARQM